MRVFKPNTMLRERFMRSFGAISVSGLCLMALGIFASSALVEESASALYNKSDNEIEVIIPAYISLSSDRSIVKITITPSALGSFDTGKSELTVSTNSANGYQLKIDSYTDSVSLVTTSEDNNGEITAISASGKSESFDLNTWGWSADGVEYNPLTPKDNASIARASNTVYAENEKTTITYGINAGMDIPAGNYQNTVRYTAIAE